MTSAIKQSPMTASFQRSRACSIQGRWPDGWSAIGQSVGGGQDGGVRKPPAVDGQGIPRYQLLQFSDGKVGQLGQGGDSAGAQLLHVGFGQPAELRQIIRRSRRRERRGGVDPGADPPNKLN